MKLHLSTWDEVRALFTEGQLRQIILDALEQLHPHQIVYYKVLLAQQAINQINREAVSDLLARLGFLGVGLSNRRVCEIHASARMEVREMLHESVVAASEPYGQNSELYAALAQALEEVLNVDKNPD